MKKLLLLLSLSLVPTQKTEAVITKEKVAMAAVTAGAIGAYSLYSWASNPNCLWGAVFSGSYRKVKLLLSIGADPNATDGRGCSMLHWAVGRGHTDITRLLLDAGANPNYANRNHTPLDEAVVNGHLDNVILLLQRGANPNSIGSTGGTALHYAVARGYIGIVRELLKNGVSISSIEKRLLTKLLRLAANNGAGIGRPFSDTSTDTINYPEIIRMLLIHGADPTNIHFDHFNITMIERYSGENQTSDEVTLYGGAYRRVGTTENGTESGSLKHQSAINELVSLYSEHNGNFEDVKNAITINNQMDDNIKDILLYWLGD